MSPGQSQLHNLWARYGMQAASEKVVKDDAVSTWLPGAHLRSAQWPWEKPGCLKPPGQAQVLQGRDMVMVLGDTEHRGGLSAAIATGAIRKQGTGLGGQQSLDSGSSMCKGPEVRRQC